MSLAIKDKLDITDQFAAMRLTESDETHSEERLLASKTPHECRIYYFNKNMNKSPKRLFDAKKSPEACFKKVAEGFLYFKNTNILFDSSRVYTFVEALASFVTSKNGAHCFDKDSFRQKYKEVITTLFATVLTPQEALEKEQSLEDLSNKIIKKLSVVIGGYKNSHEIGLKDPSQLQDKIRCKLISDYANAIKRNSSVLQKNSLVTEAVRLYTELQTKSFRKLAKRALKEIKPLLGKSSEEISIKIRGKKILTAHC